MKKIAPLSILFCTVSAFADVNYHVTIDQPEHHLAKVNVTFPKTALNSLDIQLPDWRTGRYEILDLANGIRYFEAKTTQGEALEWKKIDKNTWRVFIADPAEVQVSYQVYANELGLRARHIDDSHAFIDASGFFMFSDAYRNEPVTVTLQVPTSWRSVSGMEFADTKHSFEADNYDILVDSPIETGINQLHKFTVDGRDYELVVWGQGNYDVDLMIKDLQKLVTTGSLIWHEYPYQRYVFMVHATSGARGATEHLNSTIIQRHRDSFKQREDYVGFISTAAHEFIHTWNVKNYRPEGLVPYDYVSENYSDLLWLSEGSTSYFEDYLLLSAGITTNQEYFKILTSRVNRHLNSPGREVQSVAATSFDKWINQGGDHGKNYSTNIYSEGALVSMALDIKLLDESNGKISYRDVHKELYQRHKLPDKFNADDVKAILTALTGNDYSNWWENNVNSPAAINFDSLFEKVGLTHTLPTDAVPVAKLDAKAKSEGALLTLTHVARNGNAWQAGLTAGDKLVAIDGHHVRNTLKATLENFAPEQKVEVFYIRRDLLKRTEVQLGSGYDKDKIIKAVASPTERQLMMYKAWMGVPHPNAKAD
ncbi:M61 family metallopeptidase (plasmid) [Pseudoalteromonas sp. T1lg65]|uniref:M61 family metallopeptidase n=1 Tax=Pseudoalteromonas sp. T1lg65 TaxID=2077101 RepID=UPI003F79B1C0